MLGKNVKRTRWLSGCLVALVILVVFAGLAFALAGYDPKKLAAAILNPGFVNFVIIALLSLAMGIASSLAYSAIENVGVRSELARIQGLSDPELLDHILHNVSKYDKRTCWDRRVLYSLERTANDKVLLLSGEFSYRLKLRDHRLTFRFVRFRSLKDREAHNRIANRQSRQMLNFELSLDMDEVELREEIGVDERSPALDGFYSVSDLHVDGIPESLQQVPGSDLEYAVQLPNSIPVGKEIRLRYRVTCPLSYADYFFSNLTLPTHGNEISLDYSTLKSELWVDTAEIFSGMENAVYSGRDGKGVLSVAQSGWAMPRSGAMFVWGRL